MFSVIRTGGKQYVVRAGDTLRVEKLDTKDGATIKFSEVLLHFDGKKLSLGMPLIDQAVEASIVTAVDKDDKVRIIKHHRRKRYLRRHGHRQKKTVVKVTKL